MILKNIKKSGSKNLLFLLKQKDSKPQMLLENKNKQNKSYLRS
jgi:hypothetical protein